jgi:hypothetical protein
MNSIRATLGLAAAFTIALAIGCASSSKTTQTSKTIESLSSMKASVASAQAQVDRVTGSMNSIAAGNDLENSYKSFKAQVAELRQSGDRAAARAAAMQEKQDEYIATWQKDIESSQDPAVKATLEQRKATVRTNYESAKNAGQAVRQAYGPLNAKLTDIQKSLSNSLTPQSVAQIRSVLDQAQSEARELKNRLGTFGAALDRMQAGLATSGAR